VGWPSLRFAPYCLEGNPRRPGPFFCSCYAGENCWYVARKFCGIEYPISILCASHKLQSQKRCLDNYCHKEFQRPPATLKKLVRLAIHHRAINVHLQPLFLEFHFLFPTFPPFGFLALQVSTLRIFAPTEMNPHAT
jgi:hypothetical protein